jgi:four helix bundle protein
MAKIERFEDIEAWKEARKLAREIYEVTRRGGFRQDRDLRDQLRRAAVSVMANIAEGFDAGSTPEFQRFLLYALRSSSEVQSHLYVALDQGYLDDKWFALLYDRSRSVKNLIGGFRRYLRSATLSRSGSRASTSTTKPEPRTGNRQP